MPAGLDGEAIVDLFNGGIADATLGGWDGWDGFWEEVGNRWRFLLLKSGERIGCV